MSYARFSEGDIYLYASVGGGIYCDGCQLRDQLESPTFATYDEAIAHVRDHQKRGHLVPARAIPDLEADRDAGESLAPMDIIGTE